MPIFGGSGSDVVDILYYTFDFGDGTPVVGPQVSPVAPVHAYVLPGTYLVTVTAHYKHHEAGGGGAE